MTTSGHEVRATEDAQYQRGTQQNGWARGLAVFAAVMMMAAGVRQVLAGIGALIQNQFYVVAPNYGYRIDVIRGAWWARVVGVALAALSLVANFLFIPYYPLWAILIIALDVAVIWALCVWDRQQL